MLEISNVLRKELKNTPVMGALGLGVVVTALVVAMGVTAYILGCELTEGKLVKIYSVKL